MCERYLFDLSASQVGVEMLMKLLSTADIPDVYDQMGSMTTVLSKYVLSHSSFCNYYALNITQNKTE